MVCFSRHNVFLSQMFYCVLKNSADPDEIPHQWLQCLPMRPLEASGFQRAQANKTIIVPRRAKTLSSGFAKR